MKCTTIKSRTIQSTSRKSQAGVALIAVMMVVAFVVVIAVSMSGRLQLQLQRSTNLQQRQQALWLALGAEEYSRLLLKKSAVGKDNVNLSQAWAVQGASFPVEQATITGEISDLQSCFNLNALQKAQPPSTGAGRGNEAGNRSSDADQTRAGQPEQATKAPPTANQNERQNTKTGTAAQQAMQRLLEQNAADLSIPAEYLVARITDWLDEDSTLQNAGGAEENDYAALEFPYYTANSLMVSVSELRTILDLTNADYALVAPLVCVLPQELMLQLNVNTIKEEQAPLLAAMIQGLEQDNARELVIGRPEQGYDNLDQFWQSSLLAGLAVTAETKSLFSVKSRYFQGKFIIETADSSFQLTSVFKVDDNQKIHVVARRFGGQG